MLSRCLTGKICPLAQCSRPFTIWPYVTHSDLTGTQPSSHFLNTPCAPHLRAGGRRSLRWGRLSGYRLLIRIRMQRSVPSSEEPSQFSSRRDHPSLCGPIRLQTSLYPRVYPILQFSWAWVSLSRLISSPPRSRPSVSVLTDYCRSPLVLCLLPPAPPAKACSA